MSFAGRLVWTGHVGLGVQVVVGERLNGTLHDQVGFTLDTALGDGIEVGEAVALTARRQLNWRRLVREGSVCRATTMLGRQSFYLLNRNLVSFNFRASIHKPVSFQQL